MWDVIISLVYRQLRRRYMAGVRRQRQLNHRWA
jgi:hypothetical protein